MIQAKISDMLPTLPAALQQALTEHEILTSQGFWRASRLRQLSEICGLSEDELLLSMLPIACLYSLPTISQFYVGAIAVDGDGNAYMGANLELEGLPLHHSVHAEQSAISHALLRGAKDIVKFVINATPCGHCRQFINELVHSGDIEIVLPNAQHGSVASYLPNSFGPKDLGKEVQVFNYAPTRLLHDSEDPLILSAIEAAEHSYAPYTDSHCGVALELLDQTIFVGGVVENAAYNPSLPPMQMALCALLRSGQDPKDIQRAVLVESNRAKVSMINSATDALHSFAQIELEVLTLSVE